MKQLVLRNATYEKIYRALGLIFLVILVVFIATVEEKGWTFWLNVVLFLILAVIFIKPQFRHPGQQAVGRQGCAHYPVVQQNGQVIRPDR